MLSARPRQYQPRITRLPSLILLLSCTLVLIALTELACRRLPPRDSQAFAAFDFNKKSSNQTARVRPRSPVAERFRDSNVDAAGPSDFLPLLGAAQTSTAPSIVESAFVALAPSVEVPPPTSNDVPVQTSIEAPVQSSNLDAAAAPIQSLPQPSLAPSLHQSSPTSTGGQPVIATESINNFLGPAATPSSSPQQHATPSDIPKSTVFVAAHVSDYLPLEPSDSPPKVESYAHVSDYLPLGPTSAAPTPANSDYLPLGPTLIYSTPDNSDYLPLGPTSIDSTPDQSDYLPLGPTAMTASPSASPNDPLSDPIVSSDPPPARSKRPVITEAFRPASDYLPLAPTSTTPQLQPNLPSTYLSLEPAPLAPASAYLPLAPTSATPQLQPNLPSTYLSLGHAPGPTTTNAPPHWSDIPHPVSPAESAKRPLTSVDLSNVNNKLPEHPTKTGPGENSVETVTHGSLGDQVGSNFLPLIPIPYPSQSAYFPLFRDESASPPRISDASKFSTFLLLPPLNQLKTQIGQSETAISVSLGSLDAFPLPTLSLKQATRTAFAPSTGETGFLAYSPGQSDPIDDLFVPATRTGDFPGGTYSFGADGILIMGGKTFDRSSPTTAVLDNGKTVEVGSNGIAVLGAEDAPVQSNPFIQSPARTGVLRGETYSVGADGAIIIAGKAFDRSSHTTAVLGDGKTVEVGPSGIAIFGAEDAPRQSDTFEQPPEQTGIFQGETYSIGANGAIIIGGKTFDRSSHTTAVLGDGKTIEVGPSGIAVFGAEDAPRQSHTFEHPPGQTGIFQGEAYSVGANGLIIIDGKTFDRSSSTTAVLRNGKTIEVSPSGIAVLPPNKAPTRTAAIAEHVSTLITTGVLAGETYSVGADGQIVIGGKTFDRSSPTTAILDNGKTVGIGPSGIAIWAAQASSPSLARNSMPPDQYVLGAFVPVIVAVIFTVPWQILNAAVKEVEPFYQLQRADGAIAADSLALEYRSSINVVATFTAMRKGHFLVWWSGLISIVAVALAPLAAETVFIGFQGHCAPGSGRQACVPELNVYPVAARIMQGILSFMAILTLGLAYFLHRGKTGLHANALSIAGLATLFQNPQVVEEFRRLNPHYTTSKMISFALGNNRYRIANFFDEDGTSAYGLIKCDHDSAAADAKRRTSFFRRGKKYASVDVVATEDQERPKKHRTFSSYFTHPASIVIFAAFVAGLETLVIYYNQTGGDTAFERWMDSQTFGVAFLFTAVGVTMKLYWTHLDDGMRNMEPYRRLLMRAVKANDSILLAPHSNPFTGLFYSLRNRHYFNAYISLVAILCLPLIVALASIPFKASLVFQTYRASTYFSIGVLSMMLIGIVWLLCRRRTPDLVRRPDTIVSMLLFLCGSNMREDFKGMSLLRRQERDEEVMRWDKSYAMGNVVGVDGEERPAVDESGFVVGEMK